jgi:Xaa-Pro aminopeptidase
MTFNRVGALFLISALLVAASPDAREAESEVVQQRYFDWTRLQFAAMVYEHRRDQLMQSLGNEKDAIFLVPGLFGESDGETFRQLNDFLYFTGLEFPDSLLVLDAGAGDTILFAPDTDSRFANLQRVNDFPGRPLGSDDELSNRSGISDVRSMDGFAAALGGWIEQGKTIWINPGNSRDIELPKPLLFQRPDSVRALVEYLHARHPSVQFHNAFPRVARQRMIKGPEEIEAMRRAATLTAQGIEVAASHVRDGIDERGLEAELEAAFKRGGAQWLGFDSIIKSGPNSLWPWRILATHSDRRNRVMHDGELVVFDVGVELDHYVSDVGRTFPVSGSFTPEQRRILEMEIGVADAIINAVRPGVSFSTLMDAAYEAIPEAERKYMQTGSFFGHHIGLSSGDPSLMDEPLVAGMIFTVEPWYYNHDRQISVFTEDVILVTADGHEVLTAGLARSPAELEALVRPSSRHPRGEQ